jgi:hypothetical protein
MRQPHVPIVGERAALMPTNVGHVVATAVCQSNNRLESVPIVREKAKSLPTDVTSVWGLAGPKRKDPAHNRGLRKRNHNYGIYTLSTC